MTKYLTKDRCPRCGDRVFLTGLGNEFCETCWKYVDNMGGNIEKRK